MPGGDHGVLERLTPRRSVPSAIRGSAPGSRRGGCPGRGPPGVRLAPPLHAGRRPRARCSASSNRLARLETLRATGSEWVRAYFRPIRLNPQRTFSPRSQRVGGRLGRSGAGSRASGAGTDEGYAPGRSRACDTRLRKRAERLAATRSGPRDPGGMRAPCPIMCVRHEARRAVPRVHPGPSSSVGIRQLRRSGSSHSQPSFSVRQRCSYSPSMKRRRGRTVGLDLAAQPSDGVALVGSPPPRGVEHALGPRQGGDVGDLDRAGTWRGLDRSGLECDPAQGARRRVETGRSSTNRDRVARSSGSWRGSRGPPPPGGGSEGDRWPLPW